MTKKAISGITLTLLLAGMLTLTVNIQLVKAEPRTWTVDDDGPADFDTIQGAINVANPQDEIYVYSGEYNENIIIRKTLSLLGQNRANTIIDGSGNQWVVEVCANNVTISGFTIKNGGKNMQYDITPNGGVKLSSNTSLVHGNIIVDNDYSGVWTGYFAPASGNTIQNNVIENNALGIVTSYFSNNTVVVRNKVSNNDFGVHITSSHNFLRNNVINDNQYNLGVYGQSTPEFIQDIDASNTVEGKPVYYLVCENDIEIPPNAGFVAAINSRNIVVRDATMRNTGTGVLFVNTTSSVIKNVTATNCWFSGIYLSDSHDNEITESTLIRTKGYQAFGLGLRNSNDNTIRDNFISIGTTGMDLYSSNNNILIENTIRDNYHALFLTYSNWNKVYHNNFLNNTIQVPVGAIKDVNVWDNGYPSGGNYWSDYDERYLNATELDDSGIWDIPYAIDENNRDNYPLMEPWIRASPVPTTIGDLKTKVVELGSEGEIDNQGIVNSLVSKLDVAQKLVGKGKIDAAKTILADAFISQVQCLSGIRITVEAADILIESARYIISHL